MGEEAVVHCSSCGARLAHDHLDTICSPCRRTQIERSARQGAALVKDSLQIKAAFDSAGLYGVAAQLDCTPEVALDVVLNSRLVPIVSQRRRELLRRLVALPGCSHVAAAEALGISRWTVASYRSQLGIERTPAAMRRAGSA